MAPRREPGIFEQIVVPTDLSPKSTRAMDFALTLAAGKGKVTAVHAIDPLAYAFGPRQSRDLRRTEAWALARERMLDWVLKGKFAGCDTLVIEGEAAPAIVEYARVKKASLIVLGTAAHRHAARLLLGSVAEEIFREADCPVLVLGPKTRPLKKKKSVRIVFATDLEPHSLAALPQLSRISRRLRGEIWAVRAVPAGLKSPISSKSLQTETQEMYEMAADRNVRNRTKKVALAFGSPVKAITAFARRIGATAIVMGIRSGGAMPRAATHIPWIIAHQVIAEATCPVMTIRG